MTAIKKAIVNTPYNDPQDGRSAITIKVVDKNNSKIIHSCDFAIVREIEYHLEIIKYIKEEKRYVWNKRELTDKYQSKAKSIKKANKWKDLRVEYLNLKNNNQDSNKKSYQLYLEAINNLYNNLHKTL